MMKTAIKLLLYTVVAIIAFCALSYHNDTDVDGSLSFGFPCTIYEKSVNVMTAATGEIGQSEGFHPWNIALNIAFAFAVSLIFFVVKRWFKNRRHTNRRERWKSFVR